MITRVHIKRRLLQYTFAWCSASCLVFLPLLLISLQPAGLHAISLVFHLELLLSRLESRVVQRWVCCASGRPRWCQATIWRAASNGKGVQLFAIKGSTSLLVLYISSSILDDAFDSKELAVLRLILLTDYSRFLLRPQLQWFEIIQSWLLFLATILMEISVRGVMLLLHHWRRFICWC